MLLPEALDFRLLLGDHAGKDIFQVLGRGEGAVSSGTYGRAKHVPPPPERGNGSGGSSYRGGAGVAGGKEDTQCILWKSRHTDSVLPGESPTVRPSGPIFGEGYP